MSSTKILNYAKKIKSINYLGGECNMCREDNIFKLTFHHRNPEEKEFGVGVKKEFGWVRISKELDKCDLLCNNCHRELHYKEELKCGYSVRNDKQIYLEYGGAECVECGYNKCASSLSFHHRNPEEKDFWIGGLNERINSINELSDRIKNEIDKCDVLCANCHVMKHVDLEFFEKNKEKQGKIKRSEVYKMYDTGIKQIEIAKHFKASKGTISDIIKKRNND